MPHRLEDNARIRFLSPEEENCLRAAIEATCPEPLPELILSLNTGLRLSEQYGLRWENVLFSQRSLLIPRSKNGTARHLRLNQAAQRALEALRQRNAGSEFVCGGVTEPRPWFEPAVRDAGLSGSSWHCLRHMFASRLIIAGVDIRTLQELLGHKTIAMTVRYSHLAPKHMLAAVERLDTLLRVQLTPPLTPAPLSNQESHCQCCSKSLDGISLQPLRPGGGMADAGDLKSPVLKRTCGFDSHPGHSKLSPCGRTCGFPWSAKEE